MKIDKDTAFRAGFHFTWGAMCCLGVMMLIGTVATYLFTSGDDCDKSRWNRCGLEVVTDNKTGIQYLVTSHGGIIKRNE
jgi:hypothetical protein